MSSFSRTVRFLPALSSLLGVAVMALLSCLSASAGDTVPSLKELNRQVKAVNGKCTPATVALVSARGTTGSGVIVSPGGLILTAAHVVQGVDEMVVIFPNGKTEKGQVLGANYTRDAAMVKIIGEGPWPHVSIGDSDKLHVGDYVVALGHSKGFDPNRRPPIRFGRLLADGKQRFMMSECTLIGGDSGGPLFNLKGELVGIHSSIGPNVVINNHVPASVFMKDWRRLSEGDQWGSLGMNPMADPENPVLGFAMLGTRPQVGVVVEGVVPGSPADRAGLLPGDLITHLSERNVQSPRGLVRELERYKPGDKAELTLVREGKQYKVPVTFGRLGDLNVPRR